MAHVWVTVLIPINLALGRGTPAFRSQSIAPDRSLDDYSFDQYAQDFGRAYAHGSAEYEHRLLLFQTSLDRIHELNARNAREGRAWLAGIHPFMDRSEKERKAMNGYKPSHTRSAHTAARMTVLQTGVKSTSLSKLSSRAQVNATLLNDFSWEDSAAMRDQGDCGSCWAISATEAVEAQLKKNGVGVKLSAQALVDCVPNPQHCGGTGGCDGATGELAYTFMQEHGIPLESDLPYTAETGACPISGLPKQPVLDGPWPSQKRAMVSGWNQLPSNKAAPLVEALVQQGPVVVALDANNWFEYHSGIFDGCDKDAELGHAVLLKGYGADNGKNYWRIQNSWGPNWGERGHIRLVRHDDEDNWCGTDKAPQKGVGCDGGPSEVTVCGTCGLLYDPIVPEGVRLESGSDSSAPVSDYMPWRPPSSSTGGAEDEVQKMKSLFGA